MTDRAVTAQPATVSEALRAAARRLADAGVPDAPGDARALMAHALGVARGRVTLLAPDPLPAPAAGRLDEALAARLQRVPVSRIRGLRAFHGHEFRITPDVLDPRPETETLVDAALAEPFEHVIDLGTGSGAIVLSLLAARPGARGTATDLSPAALAVAAENAERLGLQRRVTFVRADWWQGVEGRFDLVVSNPPYIAAHEIAGLAPEVRAHDPAIALSPGSDALAAYRRLLAALHRHLAPGGRALFEFGASQEVALAALAAQYGFANTALLSDLDGRPRVIVLRAGHAVRPD